MYRNTAALITFLAVIAGLVAFINIRNVYNPASPTEIPTPTAKSSGPLPYISDACGVQLAYPDTLTVSEGTAGATLFIDTKAPDNFILLACRNEIPIPSVTITTTESAAIRFATGSATISAAIYHTQENGLELLNLIFRNPINNMEVLIAGVEKQFSSVLNSLRIMQ